MACVTWGTSYSYSRSYSTEICWEGDPHARLHSVLKPWRVPPFPTCALVPGTSSVCCVRKMPPISRLQLLVLFILSFLALRTTCHPRPTPSSLTTTVDPAQANHEVAASPMQDCESGERSASTSLRRRNLGFHEFLDIGLGWNMYYSSWASIALPVRK